MNATEVKERRKLYLKDLKENGLSNILCLLSILCEEFIDKNLEEADCWVHRSNVLKNLAELCLYPNELSTYYKSQEAE